jgi:hypothetical protein
MTAEQETRSAINEFKQFMDFVQNLWAALAGVSVLFPLSNTLTQVVPLAQWPDGGFSFVSPPLVTGVTTLASLFVILLAFGGRERFQKHGAWSTLSRQAGRSFVLGGVALVVYMLGHYLVANDFYFRVVGWESDDLRRISGDFVLLIAYVGFFALVTRAFLLLGLREYLRGKVRVSSQSRSGDS